MAKYIDRLFGTSKEFFFVQIKILSVDIPVKEITSDVQIEWKRGQKKTMAKMLQELSPLNHVAVMEELFTKMSFFYKDDSKGTYQKKMVMIKVNGVSNKK